jgi:putative DNA primase/helicase
MTDAPAGRRPARGKVIPFDQPSPVFSDDALALRFAELHARDLRYVARWSQWLRWDGNRWRPDDTLAVFDSARAVCRTAAVGCNKTRLAKELTSAKTVAAIERLARSDRRLAATAGQWDSDPWLLNTPDGVVDLMSGETRPHRAEDYLTRITAVGPGDACPLWMEFLARVTNSDAELQTFLQRVLGYSLTGSTRDHALFFAYGTGANGKTVFTSTASTILGDYHCAAPIETLTASSVDRHPTELADLRGARLVTAVETEEGRRWAESRIKMLTGGERVKARFMRQDLFEFTPQLKLFITGNHKPGLRSVDEAMRRRFHLIPFTVTIPPIERDPDLTEKLKDEWPGILQWMIDGCLAWQEIGLRPPEVVRSATDAYLDAEDALAAWIEEATAADPNGWETTANLFASWTAWSTKAGEYTGTMRRFVQNLETRGLTPERRRIGRGFRGLVLVHQQGDPWWER